MRFSVVLPPAVTVAEDNDKAFVWPNTDTDTEERTKSASRIELLLVFPVRRSDRNCTLPSSNSS